jgi:uncharacterized membrane protein YhaH (DUF805 family)
MMFLLSVAILGALGAVLVFREARHKVLPTLGWRDLWTLDGTVDRAPYLAIGFGLMAVKYNLERLVAGTLYGRSWSVLEHYLKAPRFDPGALAHDGMLRVMLLVSLPFIWTGMALTVRRLRSAGLPVPLAALFFVPFVNLLFFLLLAGMPAREEPAAPSPFLDRLIPRSQAGAAVAAVLAGGVAGLLLTRLSTAAFNVYGTALFVGSPFVLGLTAALLYSHHQRRTLAECEGVAALSVTFAGLAVFAAAVEGVICLAMAAPLALLMGLMGGLLGYLVQLRPGAHVPARALALVLCGLPALMGAEKAAGVGSRALPLRTSIEVDAPPAAVWRNVVEFSELPAPTHPIFRLGFAYPVRATIRGKGVGAVRHCEFTTGAFVEPITVWDEPRRLAFSVTSQPSPMKETSWYPDIHPSHLDDFLVSEGGEFLLEELPGGRTRLTGTTWYRHAIEPSWYWKPMSDFVIHRIHERVLAHVKSLSESQS